MSDDGDAATARKERTGKHRSAGHARSLNARSSGADDEPDGGALDEDRAEDSDGANGSSSGAKKGGSFLRELAILVVLVLGLTALLRGFVFEAYRIPSGSMEQTLRIGDKVLVNKFIYHFRDIHRGDVIVFDGDGSWTPEVPVEDSGNVVQRALRAISELFGGTPAGEEDFIKRVIGVPGDKIECKPSGHGLAMYVNGTRLKERSYLYPGDKPCAKPFTGKNAVIVPKGRLWVMGDHRSLSADSRVHVNDGHFGTVPENEVIGRAFLIVWPVGHWTTLSQPKTFDQRALHGSLPAPYQDGGGPGLLAGLLVFGSGGALIRRRRRRR